MSASYYLIIVFLGDNLVVAVWPDPSLSAKGVACETKNVGLTNEVRCLLLLVKQVHDKRVTAQYVHCFILTAHKESSWDVSHISTLQLINNLSSYSGGVEPASRSPIKLIDWYKQCLYLNSSEFTLLYICMQIGCLQSVPLTSYLSTHLSSDLIYIHINIYIYMY